jgi:hypothetical protein
MLLCCRPHTSPLARHPAQACAPDSCVLGREERLRLRPHNRMLLRCRAHTNTQQATHIHTTSHMVHPPCVLQTTIYQSKYTGCRCARMSTCSCIAERTPTQRAAHLHTRNMTIHNARPSQVCADLPRWIWLRQHIRMLLRYKSHTLQAFKTPQHCSNVSHICVTCFQHTIIAIRDIPYTHDTSDRPGKMQWLHAKQPL